MAGKYVALEDLAALAEAGIAIVGENRAQDLQSKVDAYGETFTWDFIGHLQSRKVKVIAPLVRMIHSVCTDSVLEQLGRHAPPDLRVLVEVNVAGEAGKSGVAPGDLAGFLERCPVPARGLMTMPPRVERPEDSRRWFAALRELAERHGLKTPVDGHDAGLRGRGPGGRDARADRYEPVHIARGRAFAGERPSRSNLRSDHGVPRQLA